MIDRCMLTEGMIDRCMPSAEPCSSGPSSGPGGIEGRNSLIWSVGCVQPDVGEAPRLSVIARHTVRRRLYT